MTKPKSPKVKKPSGRQPKLPDAEFVRRLLLVDENRAHLAKELGITAGAVSQRALKLSSLIEEAKAARDGGAIAAVVGRSVPIPKQRQDARASSFKAGIQESGRQYQIFDHLEELYISIHAELEAVKAEIGKRREAGKTARGYDVEMLIKLVNQARSLITDAHKIRLELTNAKHAEQFIQVVTQIIQQYDPDIKRKLYVELSGLGVEGQTAFVLA